MDVAEEKEEMRRKEGRRRGERTNGRERVEEGFVKAYSSPGSNREPVHPTTRFAEVN